MKLKFPDPKWDIYFFLAVLAFALPIFIAITVNPFLITHAFAVMRSDEFDQAEKPKMFSFPCGKNYWMGYKTTYLRKGAQFTLRGEICLNYQKREWVFVPNELDEAQ